MGKSLERARKKLERNARAAGEEIRAGFAEGKDPMRVILEDPALYGERMARGVARAVEEGRYKDGVEKAASAGSWRKSGDKAARNFETEVPKMVANWAAGYNARMAIQNEATAKALIEFPQKADEDARYRIQRNARRQELVHELTKAQGGR